MLVRMATDLLGQRRRFCISRSSSTKALDDLVDPAVGGEAKRLGAPCQESLRPARDDLLYLRIEFPADAGIGLVAAAAADRRCHLADRDRKPGELQ